MTTNTIQTVEVITQGLQGPAGISDGDRGDVTVSSNGTSIVIDSDAVTYDKIQDLVTANRVLGASEAGTIGEVQITNDYISSSAAIALSKLATGALPTAITVTSANISDLSLVNADVNASAAIAGTKISPDFGSQNIVTTGTVNGKVVIAKTDLSVTSNSAGTSALSYDDSTGVFTFTPPDLSSYLTSVAGSALTGTSLASGIVSSSLTSVGSLSSLDVTGNITVGGTVDGRDIATDGSKLDGIDTGAKDDQTAAEIKTLLDSSGLVNAQIDASAAIAGTKISPDFGSQNIYTEGRIDLKDININDTTPSINFNDGDANPDFQLLVNSGVFSFKDATNSTDRLVINSDGHVDVTGNLDVGAGVDVTGDISVTGDIKVGTAAGTANQYLKKNSSNELAWETVSPGSAGGANAIHLNDDVKLTFGDTTTPELEVYHTGENAFIENTTGDFLIRNSAGNEIKIQAVSGNQSIVANAGGSVDLHHDGSGTPHFQTTADGCKIPNVDFQFVGVNAARTIYFDASINGFRWNDNAVAYFGNGQDLAIYHDGNDNVIDAATSKNVWIKNNAGNVNEAMAAFRANGSSELYWDGTKKLYTVADGAITTGHHQLTNGNLYLNDNYAVRCGNSGDLQIYHDGTDSFLDNSTGELTPRSDVIRLRGKTANDTLAVFVEGGASKLYFDGSNQFETTDNGAKVTGKLGIGVDPSSFFHLRTSTNHNLEFEEASGNLRISALNDARDANEVLQFAASEFNFLTGNATFAGDLTINSVVPRINLTDSNDNPDWAIINNNGVLGFYDPSANDYRLTINDSGNATFAGEVTIKDTIGRLHIQCDDGATDSGKWLIEASSETEKRLYIGNFGDGASSFETSIRCQHNGPVDLRYNGTQKFQTTSDGVHINGKALIGHSSSVNVGGTEARVQVLGASFDDSSLTLGRFSAGGAPALVIAQSRNTTIGQHTALINNDSVGSIFFRGSDGVDYEDAAAIRVETEGDYTTSSTPGRLIFQTTKTGETTCTTALTLDKDQNATFAGAISAPKLTLSDDGASSPIFMLKTDDTNPWGFTIKNDTYSTSADHGFKGYQANDGDFFLRLNGNSEYNNFYLQQHNGTTLKTNLTIDSSGKTTFGGAVSVASKTVSQTATAVSALEIDCATGNYFTKAISASSTFTFANVPASGTAYGFVIEIDVTGSSTAITWPAAVKWPGGTAPTLTDTKTHVFTFATVDGGTSWRASSLVDYTT